MRFGIDVAQHQLEWPELLRRVKFAEEAGFDGAWVFDHFQALYGARGGPCLEGWSLLAALAVSTSRIRLGNLVTGITHRHPSVLATQAVTVDVLSGGRLELGLGAAWNEPEHRQLGIPFPPTRERAARLEEAVQVIRKLMTTDRASFGGKHYTLASAAYRPRPVQKPHPPIWIGAGGERLMLPIVARQADAWHGFGPASELARKSALLDELATKAKRDPQAILRSSSLSLSRPMDTVRRYAEQLAKLGFGYLVAEWPTEGWKRMEEFATKVLPDLATL